MVKEINLPNVTLNTYTSGSEWALYNVFLQIVLNPFKLVLQEQFLKIQILYSLSI